MALTRSAALVRLLVLSALSGLLLALPSPAAAAPERRLAGWLPYWDQSRATADFLTHADLYAEVSPFWYELRSTGAVSAYPGAGDRAVVDAAKARGVRVVPTVTNQFDGRRAARVLATSRSRSQHASALVALVVREGYDGLDVDYENLQAADRGRFTAFVRLLADRLHARGRTLSVAVHPKTAEPGTWHGPRAQDWRALGAAADRLRVMAYDHAWEGSPAGPVAPTPWVEQVAAFAASQVEPRKVQLGVPLYGYDWSAGRGEGVTFDRVQELLRTHVAVPRRDPVSGGSTFTYLAQGVPHTVWFSDAGSVDQALAVADRHGLAGVALWRLGGQDPAVWDAVRRRWG